MFRVEFKLFCILKEVQFN